MIVSEITFANCEISVEHSTATDPEDTTKEVPVATIVIKDPHGPAIYRYPMTDHLRKELIKGLTGGVAIATDVKDVLH